MTIARSSCSTLQRTHKIHSLIRSHTRLFLIARVNFSYHLTLLIVLSAQLLTKKTKLTPAHVDSFLFNISVCFWRDASFRASFRSNHSYKLIFNLWKYTFRIIQRTFDYVPWVS